MHAARQMLRRLLTCLASIIVSHAYTRTHAQLPQNTRRDRALPTQVVEMCSQYKRRTRALQQGLVDSQRQVEIGKTQIVQLSKLMAKATIMDISCFFLHISLFLLKYQFLLPGYQFFVPKYQLFLPSYQLFLPGYQFFLLKYQL